MINKEKTLTWASIVAGVLGLTAFLGAWLVGAERAFDYQARLFAYAETLLLIAIWLKLGAIYHKQS